MTHRVKIFLALLLALSGWAGAHEITFSHVDVRLNKAETQLEVKLPIKALLHERPSPLPAGTTEKGLQGPLSEAVELSLTKLVTARLKVASGSAELPLTVQNVQAAGGDVALTLTAPTVQGQLGVQANLFPADTLHKVFVNVYHGEELAGQYALDGQKATLSLDAPAQPLWDTIITFIREGIHHIFIGPDHILFVLALILLGGALWQQVKIITAFTLSHSITLALATLNIVSPPARLVESIIALSIVVVGLHDLWHLRRGQQDAKPGRDLRVLFAFVFGLIHGFGFASVLAELGLPQQALAWSLAAFNIGVEVGQVVIVLLAAPLLYALRYYAPPRASQAALTGMASLVVLVGAYWLWERVTGVG